MSGGYCKDCFTGTTALGTPAGTVTTLHGLSVYVAEPGEGVTPKGIICYIPDAFGWNYVNNRLLADKYAKRGGFLVYVPDFMNGKPVHPDAQKLLHDLVSPASWLYTFLVKPLLVARALVTFGPFMYRTRPAVSMPRVVDFITALRTSPPPFPTSSLKIGAVGICWGGYHTVQLCNDVPATRSSRYGEASDDKQSLIDCGFTAHPSNVVVPDHILNVHIPLSVAVGETDMAMKGPKVQEMKMILEVKNKGDHVVNIIPGAKHGFSVRSDPEDKHQMDCAEKAETQAIEWFTKWFT